MGDRTRSVNAGSVCVVSPLPARNVARPESGVAQYVALLAGQLQADGEVRILGQKGCCVAALPADVTAEECWRPGLWAARDVDRRLEELRPSVIHLQHEYSLFGGLVATARMTSVVGRRSKECQVVTTLHSVVSPGMADASFLRRNGFPPIAVLGRLALRVSLRRIRSASSVVVVHHEYFRGILVEAYGFDPGRVRVIPMGSGEARKESDGARLLGHGENTGAVSSSSGSGRLPVALVFGFLASYKLPELVVAAARRMKDCDVRFAFCVGFNRRARTRRYRRRYEALHRAVAELGEQASWCGYIPDEAVAKVFARSDVLVLPYTDCVSVSAVAGLAASYGVAVCYSSVLEPVLGVGGCRFALTAESLEDAIRRALAGGAWKSSTVEIVPWTEVAQETVMAWRAAVGATSVSG